MRKYIKTLFILSLCFTMIMRVHPISASENGTRGTYMSSAKVFAKVTNEDDIIGNAVVTCLSQVKEIDVDMYLQRGYGTTWQNASAAYNMNVKDASELDEYAIIRNVTPGIYRVYIEARVTGYDGLWDTVGVGTGTITINT